MLCVALVYVYINLQFLNYVIIVKINILPHQAQVTIADFGYPVSALSLTYSQSFLNYLVFQPFDFERT